MNQTPTTPRDDVETPQGNKRPADFDVAVVGSGFAGALAAMMARRMGWRVILIERGRHPRFVIGESSTPLANLILEQLATRFELGPLIPLAKWGTWQAAQPGLPAGLKRGFTFYRHQPGLAWSPSPDLSNELLVAASPNDHVADTHWYRPAFDQNLVHQAVAMGVEYVDGVDLDPRAPPPVAELTGHRAGATFRVRCRMVIDASGTRGYLHRRLAGSDLGFPGYPQTQAVFSHFQGVERWDRMFSWPHPPPYPPDDAAVHHVFPGGWMWVLRFNHGITSAGFALCSKHGAAAQPGDPKALWRDSLARFPSLAAQFAAAEPVEPLYHLPGMAFRSNRVAGPDWIVLPGAAGFVDPLLSTGFPLALMGLERLANHWQKAGLSVDVPGYVEATHTELEVTARLINALYLSFDDFPRFQTLAMLYFVAASYSESARRLGRPGLADGFLLAGDARFQRVLQTALAMVEALPGIDFEDWVRDRLEPWNVAGLLRPSRRPWYPAMAADMLESAGKLGVSEEEMAAMLRRTLGPGEDGPGSRNRAGG